MHSEIEAGDSALQILWLGKLSSLTSRFKVCRPGGPASVPRICFLCVTVFVVGGAVSPRLGVGEMLQLGADIARHGTKAGALPCMACHGVTLEGNAAIGAPRLAGLFVATTYAVLDKIAEGHLGKNYVMRDVAKALTKRQKFTIATYLASLSPKH